VTEGRPVTGDDLAAGIDRLGLANRVIEIHVSLRSFPSVVGGPMTLADAFLSAGCTLVVSTGAHEAFRVPAPRDDRPVRNGLDYDLEDALALRSPPPGLTDVYDETRSETDPWLGVTPAYVASRPDRVRCKRPVGNFCALGPRAQELIASEMAADVFGPLRALVACDGMVLLMGVTLTRMTFLHLAEVEAGRRPFVHWARGKDGRSIRYMGGKCSEGFDNLAAELAPYEVVTTVGASRWRLFSAADVLVVAASAIRRDPSITHCSNPTCVECEDAVAGGPMD